ncbi:MAG: hypothetical protein WC002_00980 [Candidatus Muiribacteriota bacterium]
MNKLTDFFSSLSSYFTESAGLRKFFTSTHSSYDYFMVLLAIGIFFALFLYFLYPVVERMLLDRKLMKFILFYKDITLQEKNFLLEIAKKNKIKPEYNILILKNIFDKSVDAELKNMMLKRESETKIRSVINMKEILTGKLFRKNQ